LENAPHCGERRSSEQRDDAEQNNNNDQLEEREPVSRLSDSA
jgi:hypothetical protein